LAVSWSPFRSLQELMVDIRIVRGSPLHRSVTLFLLICPGSMIALLVVGFILLISFAMYEWKLAPYPIMPRRIANRALVCACIIDFFYFFSYYVNGIYQNSWVWVITDWSTRDYTFWTNTINTSICTFGIVAGLVQRYTHRYKAPQMFGLVIRIVGMSMSFAATYKPYTALLVISPILVG
jgi:hypothetical protein